MSLSMQSKASYSRHAWRCSTMSCKPTCTMSYFGAKLLLRKGIHCIFMFQTLPILPYCNLLDSLVSVLSAYCKRHGSVGSCTVHGTLITYMIAMATWHSIVHYFSNQFTLPLQCGSLSLLSNWRYY